MHHEIAFLNEQLITHIIPTDVSKQKICIWLSCFDQRQVRVWNDCSRSSYSEFLYLHFAVWSCRKLVSTFTL